MNETFDVLVTVLVVAVVNAHRNLQLGTIRSDLGADSNNNRIPAP